MRDRPLNQSAPRCLQSALHSWKVTCRQLTLCAFFAMGIGLGISTPLLQAEVLVDFEELTLFTGTSGQTDGEPGGQFFNGNDGSFTSNTNGWTSGGAMFQNHYTFVPENGNDPSYDYWSGWAYSNVINSVTPGYQNQYAAIPGGGSNSEGGVDVGGNYAVAYTGSAAGNTASNITFGSATQVHQLELANTTYLARYALDNTPNFYQGFRNNFEDGDFLRLEIQGLDQEGAVIATRQETLVDFGDAGADDDFVLVDWQTVDLSEFGLVHSLRFELQSNLTSNFGGVDYLDPPAYFAIDNLAITAVPEPSTCAVAALGTCGAIVWNRYRRKLRRK